MKIINKKSAGLALGILFLTIGCKKNFLEVPPQGQQPAQQFWVSAG